MERTTLKQAELHALQVERVIINNIVDFIECGEALNLANYVIEERISPELMAKAILEVGVTYEDPKEEALRSEQRISQAHMEEAINYFNQAI